MSVLADAKSQDHRKAHHVESGGTGREFMHLTRGDLAGESLQEVSRGRSSEEALGNLGGAKGRRTKRERSIRSTAPRAARRTWKEGRRCHIGSRHPEPIVVGPVDQARTRA
jgi:hypothetical protein